jgi:hypothetical protein
VFSYWRKSELYRKPYDTSCAAFGNPQQYSLTSGKKHGEIAYFRHIIEDLMRSPRLKQIIIATVLSCCATGVMAQYVWLNEKGVKQYSDQPPPASVPTNKILKTPRGIVQNVETAPAEATDADGDTAKKAPTSVADKNAEFEKRRKEQAEKDKKAEEKAQQDAAKQKNCERARDYQRALSSGQRISRVDKTGERSYLSDEERTKEQSEVNRALADCK